MTPECHDPDAAMLTDRVIGFLNELSDLDPHAITALVETRVSCDLNLAVHPYVQTAYTGDGHVVGLLGILNGLLASQGAPLVCSHHDEETGTVLGFALFEPPQEPSDDTPSPPGDGSFLT